MSSLPGSDPADTSGRVSALLRPLLVLGYPLVVYLGLTRFSARTVALGLLAVLAARFVIGLGAARAEALRPLVVQALPVALVIALSGFANDARLLLALPVLVNLALLFVFGRSLTTGQPIVEQIARLQDPDLTPDEVRYCRSVTAVWCGFFVANAACIAVLTTGPVARWALYTGVVSYVLMGVLFAGEYIVRRARFRRFGPGPADRALRALLPEPPEPAPDASNASEPTAHWTQVGEKGSVLGLRVLLFACVRAGRPVVRAGMRVVALYYVLTDADVRRASREFYARLGISATFSTLYRHVRCFAYCASDRFFLLRGDDHLFRFVRTGQENAVRVRDAGRGGVVIGAHLGSFEAARAAAADDALPMSIVGYFHNAAMLNTVLSELDPELADRVIVVEPGRVGHVWKIRSRIRAGELVAFLGDRPLPGGETIEVDFLGAPARFPTGALSVAAKLGCPVLLVFCLYRDPNVYEIHCESFAERLDWDEASPEARRAWVQRYADRLAHYVRRAPENWANFYDFWDADESAGSGDATRPDRTRKSAPTHA